MHLTWRPPCFSAWGIHGTTLSKGCLVFLALTNSCRSQLQYLFRKVGHKEARSTKTFSVSRCLFSDKEFFVSQSLIEPYCCCYGVVLQEESHVLRPLLIWLRPHLSFKLFLIHQPQLSGSNHQKHLVGKQEKLDNDVRGFCDQVSLSYYRDLYMP